ncbi:MAG: methyltransferase domain-containing protein [Chloroflexales bacterium]|nr:methyltransferase domain-containing protein [Chloroflexales bacterium]
MDRDTLIWLRSPPGQTLLQELAALELHATNLLRELSRLRDQYPPELARAAVEQTLLRRRAQAKFPSADRLFFTREALEQASSAPVAKYRARRFAEYRQVADLCCGIGGDALALADAGSHIIAVDHNPVRLAIAAANAEELGQVDNMTFVCADLLTTAPPAAEAIFCDPGRRAGGKRRFHVEQYEPPLSRILTWRTNAPALAIKMAPGVDPAELPSDVDSELEFISLDGELKEAVLWCAPLATTRRRATVLRTDATNDGSLTSQQHRVQTFTLTEDASRPLIPLTSPRGFLYEPDPAVIRAGLVAELAAQIGTTQLDAQIAYLTGDTLVPTPFARVWHILDWMPFNLKRLRARLRDLDAGAVTVKKRGAPIDPNTLARQLSGKGERSLVVALTRIADQRAVLICAERCS